MFCSQCPLSSLTVKSLPHFSQPPLHSACILPSHILGLLPETPDPLCPGFYGYCRLHIHICLSGLLKIAHTLDTGFEGNELEVTLEPPPKGLDFIVSEGDM